MTNDKVNEALRECDARIVRVLRQDIAVARHATGICGPIEKLEHVRWMVAETLTWPAERLEKKFRWLGFIQGVLWAEGVASVDTLKKMNMPDPIDDTHLSPDGK